jgi:hypothetical protein
VSTVKGDTGTPPETTSDFDQRLYRYVTRVLFPLLTGVMVLVGIASVLGVRALIPGPVQQPFMVQADLIHPEDGFLCPGDTLIYDARIHVRRAAIVQRVATWWTVDGGFTIIPDQEPEWIVWVSDSDVQRRRIDHVPSGLPPGRYERRVAYYDAQAAPPPSFFRVPFEIGEDCE